MHSPTFTHAGGIVVQAKSGEQKVLVVRPTRPGAAVWVLPKGHIESGEGAEKAALREVREEAGALCENAAYLGYTAFHVGGDGPGEDVVCAFFAMDVTALEPSEEDRERAWLTLGELERAMPFEDTLALVRLALTAKL